MLAISSTDEYLVLKKRAGSSLGLVVHFGAVWCDPCKAVREFFETQAPVYQNRVLFADVDCEAHEEICDLENITSVPFIVFFRSSNGDCSERVAEVSGAKLDLIQLNLFCIYGDNGALGNQRQDFPTLDDYLSYLIGRPGVVLFLTGTPSQPRCGFTSRLCDLVQSLQVPFLFYDVMASDEVCEGLKRFSNWPTFPQVYVNGTLVGGYDVCQQLYEEGELKSTLTAR